MDSIAKKYSGTIKENNEKTVHTNSIKTASKLSERRIREGLLFNKTFCTWKIMGCAAH